LFTQILLIAAGVIAAVIVVLVILIALRPAEFSLSRSTTIAAPPQAVFAQVNDFHRWDAWSPWAKLDPGMTKTYEGAPAGVGAVYTWSGNNTVGEGRMTITDSRPGELVRIRLEFKRPMTATNVTDFTFTPAGDRTIVVWSMSGRNGFMAKAFGFFVNMDKLVGGDFEKGLASLKAICESGTPA
jgi:uncharacterized protein YndB with AHSA1/START domain